MLTTSVTPPARKAIAGWLATLSGLVLTVAPVQALSAPQDTDMPAAEQSTPVSLAGTAAHTFRFQQRDYPVWVDLPRSYQQQAKPLPVLVVTDAPYAFPLIKSIRTRVGQNGRNIADFILVGIGYPAGEAPADSRSRDYTPSNVKARAALPGESYSSPVYGNAAAFAGFVATQVMPQLAQRYQFSGQRIYLGHSYGALLGAKLLLQQPGMFTHYVLSSPSLWFDRYRWRKQLPALLAQQTKKASVSLYVGGYEQPGNTPRHNQQTNMVVDMQQFAALLDKHGFAVKRAQVIADEDHLTVYPRMVTDLLLNELPGHGPYSGG